MSSTVLIAAPEHLPSLKKRDELGAAHAFPDSDALQALDYIMRERPAVVVLERQFAGTSRGAALINRIKADPSLTSCEIRLLSQDGAYARVSSRRIEPPAEGGGVATAVAAPPAPPALDYRGTRRAPRYKLPESVEVTVDGNPAMLIDVSTAGAQVLSSTVLKPNQRIRMALPGRSRPLRLSAGVAWAAFEIPQGGPRYRAGVEFVDPDPDALGKFIESKTK